MQITQLVFEQMFQFLLMLLMGYAVVRAGVLKPEDSRILSEISVYLVLPCVIVNAFQIDFTPRTMRGLLLAFAAAIAAHGIFIALAALCGRIFHLNPVEKLSVIYSNSGNMIIPVVVSVLGEKWVIYSSAFISVQIILLWTHGKRMICREEKFGWKTILGNINIIAIIIGIFLFVTQIRLPHTVSSVFSSTGNLMAPLGMIVLGMVAAGERVKNLFGNTRVYGISLLRLVIFPAAILALFAVSKAGGMADEANTILYISFLACITPASATITQMAQVYEKDAGYAGAINVITTLFCLVTIPVMTAVYWKLCS